MRDGVIKFQCKWKESSAIASPLLSELNDMRNKLYQEGLIGVYPDGIGFGNISVREGSSFLISGTQTGQIPVLNDVHYTRVTYADVSRNRVECTGPIKASSESMSHAIIYQTRNAANAVVHVHSSLLWKRYLHKAPTTADVPYGTPAMAAEIKRLLLLDAKKRIIIMAGHNDGIITFGKDLAEANSVLHHLTKEASTSVRQ